MTCPSNPLPVPLQEFLDNYKETTRDKYTASLDLFREWMGCSQLSECLARYLSQSDDEGLNSLRRFQNYLLDAEGYTPASVNSHLSAIQSLHNFLLDRGITERAWSAPCLAPWQDREDEEKRRQDIQTLLEHLKNTSCFSATRKKMHRDLCIVLIALGYGVSRAELVNLTMSDLETDETGRFWLHLEQGKRRCSDELQSALESWFEERTYQSGYLFCSLKRKRRSLRAVELQQSMSENGLSHLVKQAAGLVGLELSYNNLRYGLFDGGSQWA